jgi:hypothetical protein
MIGLEHLVMTLLKRPLGRLVVGLAMAAFGASLVCLAYPRIDSMRQLNRGGVRTIADVIDARISSDAHGFHKSYDIRYRFRLRPHGPWYERSEKGPLARKQLWATLPKEKWEQVTRVGKIDVEYLPSDPSVNEIAGEAGRELTGTYCLLGLGGLFGIPGLAIMTNGFTKILAGGSGGRRSGVAA